MKHDTHISSQDDDRMAVPVSSLFNNWLRYFMGKWWLFLLVGILSGIAGAYYAYSKKATYESRLTFSLEEGMSGNLSGALNLASEFGINLGSSGNSVFTGDNITEILKSQRIIERVLLSVDTINNRPVTMAEEYLNIIAFRQKLKPGSRLYSVSFPVGMGREKYNYLQDSVLFNIYYSILKALKAGKPDKKLDIYEIKMTSLNERFSKIFTDRLVQETIMFYTELRTKRSKETLDILESRVAQLKGSLNSSISSRAAVQDANVNPAFSAAQVPLQKKQVDISVYGAAYTELFKNLELARYQYLNNIPLLQIIDEPRYPLKRNKLGRLKTAIVFCFFAFAFTFLILILTKVSVVKERS